MFVHFLDLYCLQLGHRLKFLILILSYLTISKFTVKDSFSFVEQDSSFYICNLDVDSLLTNIWFKETINICTKWMYDQNDTVEGLNLNLRN